MAEVRWEWGSSWERRNTRRIYNRKNTHTDKTDAHNMTSSLLYQAASVSWSSPQLRNSAEPRRIGRGCSSLSPERVAEKARDCSFVSPHFYEDKHSEDVRCILDSPFRPVITIARPLSARSAGPLRMLDTSAMSNPVLRLLHVQSVFVWTVTKTT